MLLFLIPFSVLTAFMPGPVDQNGNEINIGFPIGMMFLVMPLVQGIFGHLMIRIGLWVYNKLYIKIAGIEFGFKNVNS